MNKIKGALRSKTMRFNAMMGFLMMAEENLHLLKPVLGEKAYGILSFITIAGNWYFRYITTESLEDKGNDKLLRS